LPEFWRRFQTEMQIWGLLAMSYDLLIGYTGMISFGHSAFFGLGMYGAETALISSQPPNLWMALHYGLVGSAAVAGIVANFSLCGASPSRHSEWYCSRSARTRRAPGRSATRSSATRSWR